jgi:hypothetical protein
MRRDFDHGAKAKVGKARVTRCAAKFDERQRSGNVYDVAKDYYEATNAKSNEKHQVNQASQYPWFVIVPL